MPSPWPPITLAGRVVTLAPLAPEHEDALFALTPPDTLRHFLDWPGEWTRDAFRAWLHARSAAPGTQTFVVLDTSTGAPGTPGGVLGSTAYMDINPKDRSVEIGSTWYTPSARGTRVNPESKLLLLRHAFETHGVARVTLKCDARNIVSQRAIAGIGAVREGTLRRHRRQPDGYLRDTVYFSVIAEDWPRVRALLESRLADAPPSGRVTVRAATAADVPAVLPMVRAICELHAAMDPDRFGFRPDIVERYARWLPERAADPRSVFLVAETDASAAPARIVGYLVGTVEPEIPIYWIPESGWIHDVWVDPSFRARGAARALVHAAVQRFRGIGVARLRLETARANDAARAVFASCGFRHSTTEMLLSLTPPPRA